MTSYYPTIEEDLQRAKDILAKGRNMVGLPHPTDAALKVAGGTIYGADIYAAYKLLESFVAEIERLAESDTFQRQRAEKWLALASQRALDIEQLRDEIERLATRERGDDPAEDR